MARKSTYTKEDVTNAQKAYDIAKDEYKITKARMSTMDRGDAKAEKRYKKAEAYLSTLDDTLKTKKEILDVDKKETEELETQEETVESIRDLSKDLVIQVNQLNKGSKDYLKNTVGIEDLTGLIDSNLEKQTHWQGKTGPKAAETSLMYGKINESLTQTVQGLVDAEVATGKLGTSAFSSGLELANLRLEGLESLERELDLKKASGEIDGRAYKSMRARIGINKDLVKVEIGRKNLLEEIDSTSKAAASSIIAPLEKLTGLMEKLPFGGLISHMSGLKKITADFGESASKDFAKALDPNQPETMDNAIKSIGSNATVVVKKMGAAFKGLFKMLMANPMLIMVATIIAAGMALKKLFGGFTELRKEMGLTFGAAAELQSNINLTAARFKFMGVSAEDVKSVVTGIQNEWGGVGQATEENIRMLTEVSNNLGMSGENAAKLSTQMMAVGSGSREAALSQMESIGHLAKASGVAPAAVMADIAENTEAFAGFAKDGGMNVMKAAIAARKLGLDMGTVTNIADSLLDFESSIEAQMEASMLTGRAINTDKARQLALSGDLVGMQKEVTKQIGTQADWEALNIVQRKALAKAFGMEVSEVAKMMATQARRANMTQAEIAAEEEALKEKAEKEERNQEMISDVLMFIGDLWAGILKASKMLLPVLVGIGIAIAIAFFPITAIVAGVMLLIYGFNKLAEIFPGIQYALAGIAAILAIAWMRSKGIGGSFLKMIPGLDKVGKKLTGMTDSLKNMVKGKGKGIVSKITGGDKKPGEGIVSKVTGGDKKPKTPKVGGGKKGGGIMESMFGKDSKIDFKKMIMGAAAMLIVAVALFVFAKALQEFMKTDWASMAKAIVALAAMVIALVILGKIKGQLIQGAIAMLILSAALIPFAFALQMFSNVDFAQVLFAGIALIAFALALGVLGGFLPFIILGSIALVIMSAALLIFGASLMVVGLGMGLIVGAIGNLFGLFSEMKDAIPPDQLAQIGAAMISLGAGMMMFAFGAMFLYPAIPALLAFSLILGIMAVSTTLLAVAMERAQTTLTSIVGPITELASAAGSILLLAGSFAALGVSMGIMALGAIAMIPALPVLIALNKMGMLSGVSLGGGGEEAEAGEKEANPVEIKLTETNMKLDKLITLMGEGGYMVENLQGIKRNTGIFADEIM